MKVASVVPVLPSVTVTSLMLIRGSSSRMVPTPWPSAMIALVGLLRLTKKVSFGFAEAVAVHQDGDGLAGLAGGEGHRAEAVW